MTPLPDEPPGADLFRRLVENAADGVAILDETGVVRYTSPASQRLFGYDRTGGSVFQNIDPDDAGRVREAFARLVAEPDTLVRLPVRVRGGDGTSHVLDVTVQNLLADPVVRGIVVNWRDVTEQTAAVDALRLSEERFRTIFEAALDAIVVIDDDVYVDVNPAACALYGLSREELIGRRLDGFGDDPAWAPAELRRLPEHGSLAGEGTLVRPGGTTREIEFRVQADFVSGRHLAIIRDVTERKELQETLVRSERLEAVGRLAGGIAHDFNNLLTVIRGHADCLLEELPDHDPLHADVREIATAADRAATLVRHLLAFGRRQTTRPELVDPNALVADLNAMLRRLLGRQIRIELDLAPAAGRVHIDRSQLGQIIVNLATNAGDAMPAGGTLTISTAAVELDEARARGLEVEPGAFLLLTVADTGSGMDPQTQAHAFEPFFTSKEAGHGAGLGLASVYGIVRQHGGAVRLESEPDRGSTALVYLPQATSVALAERSAVAGERTILLVEDEPAVRDVAERILAASGYAVLAAGNGKVALELAEAHGRPVDLLLTDVVMPGMSGLELAERLRAAQPGVRVLYTSGYVDHAVLRRDEASEGTTFLPKPFSPEALTRAAVAALAAEGPPPTPDE